jgi:hypothetical protein
MDSERYKEWVEVSLNWRRDHVRDAHLPHYIQILGIVDAEIRGIRKEDVYGGVLDADDILKLGRAQIYAHLWVLGAYELVRMIAERVRNDPSLTTPAAAEVIKEPKRLFERVRIPLAKLEPSRRNETDFPVAFAGICSEGLCWMVADDVIITQRELSDILLKMWKAVSPNADPNQALDA